MQYFGRSDWFSDRIPKIARSFEELAGNHKIRFFSPRNVSDKPLRPRGILRNTTTRKQTQQEHGIRSFFGAKINLNRYIYVYFEKISNAVSRFI